MKNFQCHILERKFIVKIRLSKMRPDCNSLDDSWMVYSINSNLHKRKMHENIHEEVSLEILCQIIQNL